MFKAKIYISGFIIITISFLAFWIYSEYRIEFETQIRKVRYKQQQLVKEFIYNEFKVQGAEAVTPEISYGPLGVILNYRLDTLDSNNFKPTTLDGADLKSIFTNSIRKMLVKDDEATTVSRDKVLRAILPQIIFAIVLLSISFFIAIALHNILRKQREINLERNYFVSSLTHELKTPISIISVALEAIQNYQKDPQKRIEYIRSSREQINKLNKSIDQILTYNDDTNLNMHFETIELHVIIKEVIEDINEVISAAEGRIFFNLDIEKGLFQADKHHFKNMLYNIIENSIKYNNQKPSITISLKQAGKHFCILIKDNGIGIRKKDQPYIFDQFFRVDPYTKNGHGIGLYYVRKIVRLHNGVIQLDSIPNEGTLFTLKFPLDEHE